MEAKIDAWLKTYLNETLISPVDWEDLPEECRIKLDNFARDEAVHRADSFAHDGVLDLQRQDAIRQLVDAMAQAWKLSGDKVRGIVEDFYDSLPPQPGDEFNKLAIRLYRRKNGYTWPEVVSQLKAGDETEVVKVVLKHADLPQDVVLDKTNFIKAMRYSYDAWTLAHPKDAVAEAISCLQLEGDRDINLNTLLPLVKKRGASTWNRALELELEVDVQNASRDDLIRILKRYALIVRREGGLRPPEVEEPAISSQSDTEDVIPMVEEKTVDKGPSEDQKVVLQQPDTTIATEEENQSEVAIEATAPESDEDSSQFEQDVETTTEEESAPDVEENIDSDETIEENEALSESVEKDVLSEDDKEAYNAMFGANSDESQQDEEFVNIEESPESANMEKRQEDYSEEDVDSTEPVAAKEEASTLETPDEEDSQQVEEAAENVGKAEEEVEQGTRLQDVFVPSPQGDSRDRFANLRSGDLRSKIVSEMYDGDETMLDVFLAKLSGAPDWNRAKQFIANEFFRCKLDLHSDLGEEFFLELKESLSD